MVKKLVILSVIIILITFLFLGGTYLYKDYQIKHAKIIVELVDNLETPFLSEVKISDFIASINGKIIDDKKIDTTNLGIQKISFDYINDDNIKVKYSYELNVFDDVAPVIWLSNSYSVAVNSDVNLTDKILCGDNADANPTCEIIGDYDLNTVDTYPLTFKATDASGNVTEQDFNLYVYQPKSSSGSSSSNSTHTKFSDVIANYKTDNTQIGIDISEWQGEVDFQKLKDAGVEFVILRVGSTKGITGDYFVDSRFDENIQKANEVGIPVGIYFYSYANSKEKALEDAEWIYEHIKDYQVDLPIAFDWENWSFYNEFNLSFFGLTDMANTFLDYFKDKGYEGMLYGSLNYLENIWLKTDYPIWLAHYTTQTSYDGNYQYWQMCSDGQVDGIYGNVDINIRYK